MMRSMMWWIMGWMMLLGCGGGKERSYLASLFWEKKMEASGDEEQAALVELVARWWMTHSEWRECLHLEGCFSMFSSSCIGLLLVVGSLYTFNLATGFADSGCTGGSVTNFTSKNRDIRYFHTCKTTSYMWTCFTMFYMCFHTFFRRTAHCKTQLGRKALPIFWIEICFHMFLAKTNWLQIATLNHFTPACSMCNLCK